MRKVEEVRLLGDQVLVRCLGTADKEGSIHIPATAQDARKIHRNGGDYLHRGEVLAVGPGDTMLSMYCPACKTSTGRLSTLQKTGPCHDCGGELDQTWQPWPQCDLLQPALFRADMNVRPGDIVLYENRRDAQLQPKRFPSLDLEDDTLVVLHEEQHILAVLEAA